MCAVDTAYMARPAHQSGTKRGLVGWGLVGSQFILIAGVLLAPRRDSGTLAIASAWVSVAAGGALAVWASISLGSALTPTPLPRDGAGLRTCGPYRWIRHPIYTGILVWAWGWTCAWGTIWTVLASTALTVLLASKARWEDMLLAERYGDAWAEWRSRTGLLLPRPRHASSTRP